MALLGGVLEGFAPVAIECGGNFVEAVGEEVAVDVEGHGRVLVAEHGLDDLDIGAGRDRE